MMFYLAGLQNIEYSVYRAARSMVPMAGRTFLEKKYPYHFTANNYLDIYYVDQLILPTVVWWVSTLTKVTTWKLNPSQSSHYVFLYASSNVPNRICSSNIIYHIYHGSDPGLYRIWRSWLTKWLRRKRINPPIQRRLIPIYFSDESGIIYLCVFHCIGWSAAVIHHRYCQGHICLGTHIFMQNLKTWLHSNAVEASWKLSVYYVLTTVISTRSVLSQVPNFEVYHDGRTNCFPPYFLQWWFLSLTMVPFI